MVIGVLRGKQGDVGELLGRNPGPDGLIDISDSSWAQHREVLTDLSFKRVRLAGQTITVNFVNCLFAESQFQRLESDGHFWAARDRWESCGFSDVRLRDVVSPGNVFENCVFECVSLVNYRPSQTIFRRCRFKELSIEGLRTVRAGSALPSVRGLAGELQFEECEFERPHFSKCFFEGVVFGRCGVVEPVVTGCDFRGAISDEPWWTAREDLGDPFLQFLEEVLRYVESRLGRASASHRAFKAYVDDYVAGVTKSRDYSEVLYRGNVPDRELDAIEDALDEIEARYPF